MTKGHNKIHVNEGKEAEGHTPGHNRHLKDKEQEKETKSRSGRNPEDDQSGGTKGSNAV